MQKIFASGHAEPAPPLSDRQECWYLPIFGVYHPHKPGQIRAVFDSSAKHDGISINDVLSSGPDLNNMLLGVLIHFCKEPVTVAASIEQMFYCFKFVRNTTTTYVSSGLRTMTLPKVSQSTTWLFMFLAIVPLHLWPPIVLRIAVWQGEEEHDTEAKQFVLRNFYVDNGFTSFSTDNDAIHVLTKTKICWLTQTYDFTR